MLCNDRTRRVIVWVWVSFLVVGCGDFNEKNSRDDFGVNVLEIFMAGKRVAQLNATTKSKVKVPVKVRWQGTSSNAKITYSGKSSLFRYKRSYHLYLKGDLLGRSTYRISSQTFDKCNLRSYTGFAVFLANGVVGPEQTPVALYFNDEYKGLYQLIEPVTEEFFTKRDTAINSIYKAHYGRLRYATFAKYTTSDLKKGFAIVKGYDSFEDLVYLIGLINEPNSDDNIESLEAILDIDNYLRYLSAAVYLNHWDGYANNFFLVFDSKMLKFRFVPWDLDGVIPEDHHTEYLTNYTIWGENNLSKKLLSIPKYKAQYLSTLRTLVNERMPISKLSTIVMTQAGRQELSFNRDPNNLRQNIDQLTEARKFVDLAKSWLEKIDEELTLLGY